MSAPALVLRVTGLNAMVGFIYDFIGRPPNEGEERDELGGGASLAVTEAVIPKKGDNSA
jgi:hypothetical protein